MTTYLLDANVLIALTVAEHEHHARASTWAASIGSFAVSPVVEGSLVRFLVRLGETPATAQDVLRRLRDVPGHTFWADDLSYADADLDHVRGHRQVTDAYLSSSAGSRPDALLATLDAALARSRPDTTVLVPDD